MSTRAARPPSTAIFVYGSLKQGGENHAHLSGQVFLGNARTISGYRLFGLDGYPGMVRDESWSGAVTGEVWQVDAACLGHLDELEGLAAGLYRREPINLLPPFAGMAIETYLYARSTVGRPALGETWPIAKS